jgi:Na+/H+ antiporter NhaD/arsenite permease-like protein
MNARFVFIFILNIVGALAASILTANFFLRDAPHSLAHAIGWWVLMMSFYPAAVLSNRLESDKQTSKRKLSFGRWLAVWSLGAVALFLIDYLGTMFFTDYLPKLMR